MTEETQSAIPEEMIMVDVPNDIEIIAACYNAMGCIEQFDPMKKRRKRNKTANHFSLH
jgi:hypothetical protein